MNKLEALGNRVGAMMTLPTRLLIIFVTIFPLGMQLYISVTDWGPLTGANWTQAYQWYQGFENYVQLAFDERLWSSIGRTLFIVVIVVLFEFVIGLAAALWFLEAFRGSKIVYSILIMPMMVVPAVSGYIFFLLFQNNGPINDFLSFITGSTVQISWLADSRLSLFAVMVADIWQWSPLMFIILASGVVSVPHDQLQAARMLGASWWQRLFRIVLPHLRLIIIICIALRSIEAFKLFDTIYIMTRGGPGVATETVSVYIYKLTFLELRWSYVAAIGLAIVVVLTMLALAAAKLLRKPVSEG